MNLLKSQLYDGFVWKISEVCDDKIAVEIRNEELLEVSFEVLDISNPHIESVIIDDQNWNTGLVGITSEKLVVKELLDENDPSSYELYAIDINSLEKEKTDGNTESSGNNNDLRYPSFYKKESSDFQLITDFLAERSIDVVHGAEYLEWVGGIVMAYYQKEESGLTRSIICLDLNGKVLLNEKIDEKMFGVVFQSFFTFTDLLIFVRNRKELLVYRV